MVQSEDDAVVVFASVALLSRPGTSGGGVLAGARVTVMGRRYETDVAVELSSGRCLFGSIGGDGVAVAVTMAGIATAVGTTEAAAVVVQPLPSSASPPGSAWQAYSVRARRPRIVASSAVRKGHLSGAGLKLGCRSRTASGLGRDEIGPVASLAFLLPRGGNINHPALLVLPHSGCRLLCACNRSPLRARVYLSVNFNTARPTKPG